MADERARNDKSSQKKGPDYDELVKQGKDVMRGRSFAGSNIAATEKDQTRERQRIVDLHGEPLDESGEVTDAEIEAREARRVERNED